MIKGVFLCAVAGVFGTCGAWADRSLMSQTLEPNRYDIGMLGDAGAWDKNMFDVQNSWSYAALGDTIRDMRMNCEITEVGQFMEFSNWLRARGGVASLKDMVDRCLRIGTFVDKDYEEKNFFGTEEKIKKQIDRKYVTDEGKTKECRLPNAVCDKKGCGERAYTKTIGGRRNLDCDIFLSTFIDRHNKLIQDTHGIAKPGTYVVRLSNTLYKVVDVVLAPGYYKDGGIDQSVNTDPENTKVYVLSDGWSVKYLDGEGGRFEMSDKKNSDEELEESVSEIVGLHTWTNDMFFNIDSTDSVRGVLNNSYICPQTDVSTLMYDAFNQGRGASGYTFRQGVRLLPYEKWFTEFIGLYLHDSGESDTKETFARYCLAPSQDGDRSKAHTNGVMFEGKIANLEWLGHYLYGMVRDESPLPNVVMDEMRDVLETVTNNSTLDSDGESSKHIAAADLGESNQHMVHEHMDKSKATSFYANPHEAVCSIMLDVLTKYWTDLSDEEKKSVRCFNNCNLRGGEVITCTYRPHLPDGVPDISIYRGLIRQEYKIGGVAYLELGCDSVNKDIDTCNIKW